MAFVITIGSKVISPIYMELYDESLIYRDKTKNNFLYQTSRLFYIVPNTWDSSIQF